MPSTNVTYKLFPKKWWKKLTTKQFNKSRDQLAGYAKSKELDTGLSEVIIRVNHSIGRAGAKLVVRQSVRHR